MDLQWTRRLIVGGALCLACVACGDDDGNEAPAAAPPRYQSVACGFPLPDGQSADLMRCGLLTVPENRHKANSRTIELAVVVLHSTATNPEPEPLVYLSGGPGGWATVADLPLLTADF